LNPVHEAGGDCDAAAFGKSEWIRHMAASSTLFVAPAFSQTECTAEEREARSSDTRRSVTPNRRRQADPDVRTDRESTESIDPGG
jgi:hypothetical protein